MTTKNINTMIKHLDNLLTEIYNLADETFEIFDDMSELEQNSERGTKLHTKYNRLMEAGSKITKAKEELEAIS